MQFVYDFRRVDIKLNSCYTSKEFFMDREYIVFNHKTEKFNKFLLIESYKLFQLRGQHSNGITFQVRNFHEKVISVPSFYSVTRNLILNNHLNILRFNFLIYKLSSPDLTFLRFFLTFLRFFLTSNSILIILLRTAKS